LTSLLVEIKIIFYRLGFSVGDVIMRACFRFFGQVYVALGANSTSHFLAQVFFANYAMMRVFRVFDWLSSIPGVKSMAQKPNFGQK